MYTLFVAPGATIAGVLALSMRKSKLCVLLTWLWMRVCADGVDMEVVMSAQYMHGVHGAKRSSSSYAKLTASESGDTSVLGKLQRTLSLSLLRSRTEASGGGYASRSAVDLAGSLFSHDEDGGDVAR